MRPLCRACLRALLAYSSSSVSGLARLLRASLARAASSSYTIRSASLSSLELDSSLGLLLLSSASKLPAYLLSIGLRLAKRYSQRWRRSL